MRRRIPIANKLLLMVLTTSTILSTVMTVIQIAFEYKEKRSQQNAVIAGIESSLLPSIGQRLWDYDVAAIQDQLRPLLTSVDVASIDLKSDVGKTIFEDSRKDFTPKYPIKMEFTVKHVDMGVEKNIGVLSMVFFSDHIIAEIRFHFITLLMFNFLKTFIVAIILTSLFGRTVARPLTTIVDYLHKTDGITGDAPYPVLSVARNTKSDDEITDVIEYIRRRDARLFDLQKQQMHKIEDQTKALEASDEALKQEKARAEMNARMAQLAAMASGLAHEINNPLTVVSGYIHMVNTEIAKPAPSMDRVRGLMEKSTQTVGRIARIVAGLRAYARDGSQDSKEQALVSDLITDAFDLVAARIRASGVGLQLSMLCDEQASIVCRKVQLVHVLVALINNSFDAVHNKMSAPWIQVSASVHAGGLRILVVDSGRGIPQEIAQKMFDPFFTTKDVGEGTGLGLSEAIGIIREHGGDIRLLNDEVNTTFEISLPLAQAVAA